jgi:hypothetical protein
MSEVFDLLGVEGTGLGWIPPDERSDETNELHHIAIASMPTFGIFGAGPEPEKACLFDFTQKINGGAIR